MQRKEPETGIIQKDEKQRKSRDCWMKKQFSGIMYPILKITGKEDHHVL